MDGPKAPPFIRTFKPFYNWMSYNTNLFIAVITFLAFLAFLVKIQCQNCFLKLIVILFQWESVA